MRSATTEIDASAAIHEPIASAQALVAPYRFAGRAGSSARRWVPSWKSADGVQAAGQNQPAYAGVGRRPGHVVEPDHVGRQQLVPGRLGIGDRRQMNHSIRTSEGRPACRQVSDVQSGDLVIGLQVRHSSIPAPGQLRCNRSTDPACSSGQHYPSFWLSHSGNPRGADPCPIAAGRGGGATLLEGGGRERTHRCHPRPGRISPTTHGGLARTRIRPMSKRTTRRVASTALLRGTDGPSNRSWQATHNR